MQIIRTSEALIASFASDTSAAGSDTKRQRTHLEASSFITIPNSLKSSAIQIRFPKMTSRSISGVALTSGDAPLIYPTSN